MDKYIKSMLGLTKISEMQNTRISLQSQVDEKLQKLSDSNECDKDILNYLLLSRSYFRRLQHSLSSSELKNIKGNIQEELQASNNFYELSLTVINKCNMLQDFNKRLQFLNNSPHSFTDLLTTY